MAAGKAAAALGLSSLLLLLDFISCQSLPSFGSIGEDITLSPSSTVNFTEIVWKKGMNKVIEWSLSIGIKHYSLFKERVHLDSKSGDLVIFNLTSSDEDEYEIESVDLTNGLKFNLTVLDPLPSPTLTCTWTNESISVHCATPRSYSRHRDQLRYRWRCSSQQCERTPKPTPTVLRFTKDDDLSQEVHCVVENPQYNRTSSVVLSTCVPRNNSRNRYTLIAVPFAVLSVFGIGFKYYSRRTERTTRPED